MKVDCVWILSDTLNGLMAVPNLIGLLLAPMVFPDRNMFAGSGEFMSTADVAISMRKITRFACERIARRAFALARSRRGQLAAVHKANNMILNDGLFLEVTREIPREFPDVGLEEVLVDAMAALLVREPSRFDVVLATNFYGDILSDLASELSGSLGLGGAINIGETLAAAQAQHSSAPDIAGSDRANPTSLILSAAMLLDWHGARHGLGRYREAAAGIDAAIDATLADPAKRTADLGGPLGTKGFTAAVVGTLESQSGPTATGLSRYPRST